MKWLFFYLLFDTSGGEIRPMMRLHSVFSSEQQCNELGRKIEQDFEYQDNSLQSFSICIPESAYQDRGIKTERLDR